MATLGAWAPSLPGRARDQPSWGPVDLLRSVVRAGCDVNAAARKGGHPQINMIFKLSDLACWLTRPNPFFEFWSYSCRCTPLHCAVYNAKI